MTRSLLLLCSLLVAAQAFAPALQVTSRITSLQAANLDDAVLSRRSALATGLAGLMVALPIAAANAESTDDMVKRIAAQSASANAAARVKAEEQEKKDKEAGEQGKILVPAFLLGSVGLSLPFFLPNLIRLGKKTASMGEDDGYGNKKK